MFSLGIIFAGRHLGTCLRHAHGLTAIYINNPRLEIWDSRLMYMWEVEELPVKVAKS